VATSRPVAPFGAVVRSYTDVDGVEMLYQALSGAAPAIGVALGTRASKPGGSTEHRWTSELELLLYFASNNMRDLANGRLGIDDAGVASDSADPGLDVMMEHAEQLVIAGRCGADISVKAVRPDQESELATRQDLTIWLQTYQITVLRTIDRHRGLVDRIRSIATNIHPAGAPASPARIDEVTTITEPPP
jgi:hypothetical protein